MSFPDGLLLVDKPAGPTSYDIIRWIKPKLGGAKIGHAGTLDPLASGRLVVLIGKATKRQSDVMGSDKTYFCRFRLGIRTDTGDITGQSIDGPEAPLPDPSARTAGNGGKLASWAKRHSASSNPGCSEATALVTSSTL